MGFATNQMLKLYHHPMSAGSRYIRLLLGEYGQTAEFVEEKFWRRRPEFLALNPAGTLPVMIEEGAEPLSGALVIGEFLDETRGATMREKRLMPDAPHARAEVRRLAEWFLIKMEQEVTRYLTTERVFKLLMETGEGGGAPDSAVIRAGRANFKNHLQYISHLASTRNWLGGHRVSQADLAAAAVLSIMDYLGEITWSEEPAAREWYARIKSRPSFRPLLSDKIAALPPVAHYVDLDF